MFTFDDATHQPFIFLLSHNSPSLARQYQEDFERCAAKWAGKYKQQQIIFMARVIGYVSTLREALPRQNEIDWTALG